MSKPVVQDVSVFEGVEYTAPSGNQARCEIIGEGAMRIIWSLPPTDEDKQKFSNYAEWLAGCKLDARLSTKATEAEDYAKWKKEMGL